PAPSVTSASVLCPLHYVLFNCSCYPIDHCSSDKRQSAAARPYRIPVNINIVGIAGLDSLLSMKQEPDNRVSLDLQLVGNLISRHASFFEFKSLLCKLF